MSTSTSSPMAPSRMWCRRCRRAWSFTTISAITRTSSNWIGCLQKRELNSKNQLSASKEHSMTEASTVPKPKKSVALSGTVAGNTAVCTVGRTGNDLHYRGYDILDFSETAEFEEIAHLLIHGTLPNAVQ